MGLNGRKRGHNKGIKRAKQERKREEAEARNAATSPKNRRQYRLTGRITF